MWGGLRQRRDVAAGYPPLPAGHDGSSGPGIGRHDRVGGQVSGPTEVLVEVRAAGLSPGDRAMITGVPYVNRLAATGLRRPRQPIPGFDCAGTVCATGDAVTGFEIGDRVFGNAPGSLAGLSFLAGVANVRVALPPYRGRPLHRSAGCATTCAAPSCVKPGK